MYRPTDSRSFVLKVYIAYSQILARFSFSLIFHSDRSKLRNTRDCSDVRVLHCEIRNDEPKILFTNLQIASRNAHTDARRHRTRSRACSSARNAARNVCAFLRALSATKKPALAITTGRPRKEDQNALEPKCYMYM